MTKSQATRDSRPVAAPGATREVLGWLRKRFRRLLRAALSLVIVTVVTATAFAIWWLTVLNGLPDIGDPFEVAALGKLKIADDRNAFTFLRQGLEKLTPAPRLPNALMVAAPGLAWPRVDPELRAWVESNRQALALFRQGADCSEACWEPVDDPYWLRYPIINPGGIVALAILDGERRADTGDLAGAWDDYRAVLRMMTHLRRRGHLTLRYHANTLHFSLRQRLAAWAADARTTVAQLHCALEEVVENQPMSEWNDFSLKLEYLNLTRDLDGPGARFPDPAEEDVDQRPGRGLLPADLTPYFLAGRRFATREPERSRRVLRLLFANWLAHVEHPETGDARPAVQASFHRGGQTTTLPLYRVGPDAPVGAKVLTPGEVAGWLVTTRDAKRLLSANLWPAVYRQEQREHRALVIVLAEELYRRDHGDLPPSVEALVGAYLRVLPDDGSAESDDGTTPTISDLPR